MHAQIRWWWWFHSNNFFFKSIFLNWFLSDYSFALFVLISLLLCHCYQCYSVTDFLTGNTSVQKISHGTFFCSQYIHRYNSFLPDGSKQCLSDRYYTEPCRGSREQWLPHCSQLPLRGLAAMVPMDNGHSIIHWTSTSHNSADFSDSKRIINLRIINLNYNSNWMSLILMNILVYSCQKTSVNKWTHTMQASKLKVQRV